MIETRPIAVSSAGKKLYWRPSSGWALFSPQPAWDGAFQAGSMLWGLSLDGVIVWRGTAGSEWGHYDHSTGLWTYRASASIPSGQIIDGGSIFGYDDDHVYACKNAKVEKFSKSTGLWTACTDLVGPPTNSHVAATGPNDVWVSYGTLGNPGILYFSNDGGASWSDLWATMAAALPALPVLGFRGPLDVWAVGGTVYILLNFTFDAVPRVVRFDGATWSILGNLGVWQEVYCVWGTGDDDLWVHGRDAAGNNKVAHYTAGAWSTSFSGGNLGANLPQWRALFGDGASVVEALWTSQPRLEETANGGSSWAVPAWPDGNSPTVLGAGPFTVAGPPPYLKSSYPVSAQVDVDPETEILLHFASDVDPLDGATTLIEVGGEVAWSGGAPAAGWSGSLTEITTREFAYLLRRDAAFEEGAAVLVHYEISHTLGATLDDSFSFTVRLAAEESAEEVYFPHRIYPFFLKSIRDSDQTDGGKLLERWCEAFDAEWEALYGRIHTLLKLPDPENAPAEALDFLRWIVGFTSAFDGVVDNLSEREKRRLIAIAVRTWKRKGTELGLEHVLETLLLEQVRIENWFDLRCLLEEWEIGWADVGGADLWLSDVPGQNTSVRPDAVSWDGTELKFSVQTLLQNLEIVGGAPGGTPRGIRVLCVPTRTTEDDVRTADVLGNLTAFVTGSMGQSLPPSTSVNDYRVGVDPSEYSSYLSVQDRGTLNRTLVEGLVAALRPANERIFVRYVTFLDGFQRAGPWEVEAGSATFDYAAGEVEVYDAGVESVLRTKVVGDVAWSEYLARAQLKLESSTASAWGELRFYGTGPDDFLALRLDPTGTLGAWLRLQEVVAGVRSTLAEVELPVYHFGVYYSLHVDVEGDYVQAHLDGDLLLSASGITLGGGRISLASEAGQRLTATYTEVAEHPIDVVRIGPPVSSR